MVVRERPSFPILPSLPLRDIPVKTSIDIEHLLVWAYRDLQTDRLAEERAGPASASSSTWGAVEMLQRYGTFVQGGGGDYEIDDLGDAHLVHARVLALDDMFVGSAPGGEAMVWDRAQAEADATIRLDDDGRVWRRLGEEEHRLERIVVSTVLVLHARGAHRPECYPDLRRRGGRPRKDGEVSPGITYADLAWHRAVYAVWHASLRLLAAELEDRLAKWQVTGPTAHESPWLVRVLEAERPVSRENETLDKPLKRKRKRAA